jgi:hypothetical protein
VQAPRETRERRTMKRELPPRGVGISSLQAGEDVK